MLRFRKMGTIGLPEILVLLGAILSAFGVILGSIELNKSQEKLTKQSEELAKKSDEISRLNQTIASSVTGGDSFCDVSLLIEGGQVANSAIVIVTQHGDYPVYDVNVQIVDSDKPFPKNPTINDLTLNRTLYEVGNIGTSAAEMMPKHLSLTPSDQHNFDIIISARNGFFYQTLCYRLIKGEWLFATKVFTRSDKDNQDKVLYTNVRPGYPRNAKGEVDWGQVYIRNKRLSPK